MRELLAQYLFHWTPDRAIWLGGQTLSWDARCAGIYAGFGIALIYHLLFRRLHAQLPSRSLLTTAAVVSLPMFIDVTGIQFELHAPSNLIRHLTGLWFGVAFCCLLYPAIQQIAGLGRPSAAAASSDRRRLLLLTAAGSAASALTTVDRLPFYYLLEGLAWFGLGGLASLIGIGVFSLLRPAGCRSDQ